MNLHQEHVKKLWRAIIEFDLIEPHDRILIGLSGGKDSTFLTFALKQLQLHAPFPFEVAALTLDPQFAAPFPVEKLKAWCEGLHISHTTLTSPIAETIEKQQNKDACYICSTLRRGTINTYATKQGFNKIAYAHHQDDAVETFFMSLFYAGELRTFQPKTFLDRTHLTVIRPLLYFREQEIRETVKTYGFTILSSPCPLDGKTKRQEVKERIASLEAENPLFYNHLLSGMRQAGKAALWPAPLSRAELKQKYDRLFKQKKALS